ncbi:ABC-2 type transport system ATP-binding protein [Anaerobacterium chartisolvens]|uniref:ABC-2 type transport system ATP-binding protein n=1 Tax=Anaerobacterium chartisolvens TaxID=1297424 RepID=A0A369AV65_9FIRM|nr:ATP-binding cassette domain-containing protein [Anaerobacterium chartisolvens]RCX12953.1 ABC-2 type transport system ATP-binding protein [Anaerobacterium chartisolvens]
MDFVVQTKDLCKVFSGKNVVNRVNINIRRGDIYGFIGENGAGKTTFMRMLSGLAEPTGGTIRLFESDDLEEQRKRIGCTIENPAIYPAMTARQNLEVYRILMGISDKGIVPELLDLVGLGNAGKKKTKDFSLGMKQRLMIAVAMIGNLDFLILDEPMNGLDPMGIKEVRDLLLKLNKEKKLTIIISSHILDELSRMATCYGVIHKGNLIDEFSSKELERRCHRNLKIVVDDVYKAEHLLTTTVSANFDVTADGAIVLYDHLDEAANIGKMLVSNGLAVSALVPGEQDLEGYFMDLMRGKK